MSVFMRSLLRIIPLIGVLVLSAIPIKAQEFDLAEVCSASVEASTVCGASYYHGMLILLCSLEKNGYVPPEVKKAIIQDTRESKEQYKLIALAAAIKLVRFQEPDCRI